MRRHFAGRSPALVLADFIAGLQEGTSVTTLESAIEDLTLELLERRRQKKLLYERAVDVICVVNDNGLIKSISPSAFRSWGYLPIDLEGRSIGSVLPAQESERILNLLKEATASVDKISFVTQVRRKDGSMLDVAFTGHWSPSEGGLFCIIHDISEQKRAEKTVRQNEQRLRAALESLPVATLIVDSYGCVEFANRAANSLLGFRVEDMMGTKVSSIFNYPHLLEEEVAGACTQTTCRHHRRDYPCRRRLYLRQSGAKCPHR